MPRVVACGMWVFFQEVMIISRKNSRVHAREGCVFVKLLWEAREQSYADGRVQSCGRFLFRCYCLLPLCCSNLDIKHSYSGHCVDCDPVFWKQFYATMFTLSLHECSKVLS